MDSEIMKSYIGKTLPTGERIIGWDPVGTIKIRPGHFYLSTGRWVPAEYVIENVK